jgi:hypothetical protein
MFLEGVLQTYCSANEYSVKETWLFRAIKPHHDAPCILDSDIRTGDNAEPIVAVNYWIRNRYEDRTVDF